MCFGAHPPLWRWRCADPRGGHCGKACWGGRLAPPCHRLSACALGRPAAALTCASPRTAAFSRLEVWLRGLLVAPGRTSVHNRTALRPRSPHRNNTGRPAGSGVPSSSARSWPGLRSGCWARPFRARAGLLSSGRGGAARAQAGFGMNGPPWLAASGGLSTEARPASRLLSHLAAPAGDANSSPPLVIRPCPVCWPPRLPALPR